jgi:ketopantoate reductase
MLYDIRHHQPTEIDFLCGAIAHEAQRAGVPALLHTAMYRLIKAKQASWNFTEENRALAATKVAASTGREET